MTVCKHIITKLPYVSSERTLSNDTRSMNAGFTLCFAFQRKPEAALWCWAELLQASHTTNGKRSDRSKEALGHQQVVCFYGLFCNTALAKQKIMKKNRGGVEEKWMVFETSHVNVKVYVKAHTKVNINLFKTESNSKWKSGAIWENAKSKFADFVFIPSM